MCIVYQLNSLYRLKNVSTLPPQFVLQFNIINKRHFLFHYCVAIQHDKQEAFPIPLFEVELHHIK